MPRHFLDLAVRACRVVAPATSSSHPPKGPRPTARRQLGGQITAFSFRLAFVVDLAYVGMGALGGAAVGRATAPTPSAAVQSLPSCSADSSVAPLIRHLHKEPITSPLEIRQLR